MGTFREVQRFRAWWMWVALVLPVFFIGGMLVYQIATGLPVGNKPAPNWALSMLFLLVLSIAVLVLTAKLEVWVDAEGIHYRLLPFITRDVKWGWVQTAKLERLHALEDFGGYGIRLGRRGWGYIVSGDHALYLELTSGSRVWLSTAQPEALGAAVRGYLAARNAADSAALKRVDDLIPPGA